MPVTYVIGDVAGVVESPVYAIQTMNKALAKLDARDFVNLTANPHPDPLPFRKGEGNHRRHRVRRTEQGSEKGACLLSSPRSERGEDQGEGCFRLHTHG